MVRININMNLYTGIYFLKRFIKIWKCLLELNLSKYLDIGY